MFTQEELRLLDIYLQDAPNRDAMIKQLQEVLSYTQDPLASELIITALDKLTKIMPDEFHKLDFMKLEYI